jgi:hypothetical protein
MGKRQDGSSCIRGLFAWRVSRLVSRA